MAGTQAAKASGMPIGSPSKLNDGSWGVRVNGHVDAGDVVEVRTRSGKTWESTIEAVLWSGNDRETGDPISLCQTVSDRKKSSDAGSSTHANPLVRAGKDVARFASRLANQKNSGNEQQLLDSIRTLCEGIGVRAEFHPADAGARPRPESPPPDEFENPPLDDDDIPF